MKIYEKEFSVRTTKRTEFVNITDKIEEIVGESEINNGICYIFVPHTTAAVTINEDADPDVVADIIAKLNNLIPKNESYYNHMEGNSDAHIKSSVVGVSLEVFVNNKKLKLGTWQGIYFCEFDGPRHRNVLGESFRRIIL
jgi:secondary thiamine-phosphate synthase enzyme